MREKNYGNTIGPEEELNIKLKLNTPEMCKGDFSGSIYIWAEAI